MLVHENARLKASELVTIGDGDRERIEDAARLERISVAEAMERKKGFRYLY